jgi:hypothetical protein
MTTVIEDLVLAEAVLMTEPQTGNGWAAIVLIRHAREQLECEQPPGRLPVPTVLPIER